MKRYSIRYDAAADTWELRYGREVRVRGTYARCAEVQAINKREDAARATEQSSMSSDIASQIEAGGEPRTD